MSDRFNTLGGEAFANIFRTGGASRVPRSIDLDAPVQTIADISRIAQRGEYHQLVAQFQGNGAGTPQTVEYDPSWIRAALATFPQEAVDLWIVSVDLLCDYTAYGGFTNGWAYAYPNSDCWSVVGGPPPTHEAYALPKLVGFWQQANSIWIGNKTIAGFDWTTCKRDNTSHPLDGLPLRTRGYFGITTTTSALVELAAIWTIWLGPKGGTPPGMG